MVFNTLLKVLSNTSASTASREEAAAAQYPVSFADGRFVFSVTVVVQNDRPLVYSLKKDRPESEEREKWLKNMC